MLVRRFVDSMVKVVGEREAERGIQLGHMYSTQEALKVGLVDQALPQDQVLRTAQQEVRRWTAIPSECNQYLNLLCSGQNTRTQTFVKAI